MIKQYEFKQMEEFDASMQEQLNQKEIDQEENFKSFEHFWEEKMDQYDVESEEIKEGLIQKQE